MTYLVQSGWMREERFTHFFPALLTYIARARGEYGAAMQNTDECDGSEDGGTDGLTYEERLEIEE